VQYKTKNAKSPPALDSGYGRSSSIEDASMSDVASEAGALKRWLFDVALPLWWEQGADHTHGGFHEAISLTGEPLRRPHRARSIARQAFSYSEAGRLGWSSPWREAQRHALDYFRKHFITADATVVSVVGLDGKIDDPRFDLYNQAFALLAYASGHSTFGEAAGWRRDAVALRKTLEQSYQHPLRGFVEDRSRWLPQRSNPHMHLLEAALAWLVIDDDPGWRRMANAIAALCLEKLIDPASGALGEFFAADWAPAPGVDGRIREPGHHYEWAFLLQRWARLTGRNAPEAATRLVAFADTRGLDPRRGVAVNAVLADGSLHDPTARLWAQAERIRAYIAQRRCDDNVAAAIKGLRRFLATPTQGVWFDQLTADDVFIPEPARATSLYHIVGAVAELSAAIPDVGRRGC
jgi:mannose/cellobiose epimerase-like protein (N-acyl-D-glucosamine 2-epimerase family)